MKVHIVRNIGYATVGIYIFDKQKDKVYAAEPVKLQFTEKEYGAEQCLEPTITLSLDYCNEFLQALANGLAEYGIFPEGHEYITGELKATKYHLEDMRTVALKNKK